jgi:hypothetical protein
MFVRACTLAADNAPKITEWISAISTATLGVLGLIFTAWQWRANGFRPRLSARIDAAHEAIELRIVNKGRAAGAVEEVLVTRPAGERQVVDKDVRFEGFKDGKFKSINLPRFCSNALNYPGARGAKPLRAYQAARKYRTETKQKGAAKG